METINDILGVVKKTTIHNLLQELETARELHLITLYLSSETQLYIYFTPKTSHEQKEKLKQYIETTYGLHSALIDSQETLALWNPNSPTLIPQTPKNF